MIFGMPYTNLIMYAIGFISICLYLKRLFSTDNLEPRQKYGCLECGSEYHPHIKFCFDCKTELKNIKYFEFDEQL